MSTSRRASAAATTTQNVEASSSSSSGWSWVGSKEERDAQPQQNNQEQAASDDVSRVVPEIHLDDEEKTRKSVFYLAYGSNLSAQTFLGRRGIRPLSQINVVVPALRLTFDLAGLPYREPCFANSGIRDPSAVLDIQPPLPIELKGEKQPLLSQATSSDAPRYHKDRWQKGLVGVVYELTSKDFAKVIATEGGGSRYHDITVPCYPLEPSAATVPMDPQTTPVKAHTLYAPQDAPSEGGPINRPDPSYAQPSLRYLTLLTDGAKEHELPEEYRTYLDNIRPYRVTSDWLKTGKRIFAVSWGPLLLGMFKLQTKLADKRGRSPWYMTKITGFVFVSLWTSYDYFFKWIFGDGERTKGE
ncbi:MAG: hypothetical protein M1828_000011 [Chrysothrix sp. TS-e1954]|nr:MAG: hypothetical protein M1828_000011 [Chrysothrix sp. TS-e1954]